MRMGKADGLHKMDENFVPVNEIPDLSDVIDTYNFVGGEYSNGVLLLPHKLGLIAWAPGGYEPVGPEQEGALDGNRSRGWGRPTAVAPYGKMAFVAFNDYLNDRAVIASLQPAGERQPYTPHVHFELEGSVEALKVVSLTSGGAGSAKLLATYSDDSAVGTVSWSNPTNAATEDASYATAVVAGTTSHYLKGLNAGATIPDDATITGFVLGIKRGQA